MARVERFVQVPAEKMFAMLAACGFMRTEHRSRREVVYERTNDHDARYKVIVYTSIAAGRSVARAKGADAIRVCAIFEPQGQRGRGIAKLPKVLRTAPQNDNPEVRITHVLDRVKERMREAYSKTNACVREDMSRRAG